MNNSDDIVLVKKEKSQNTSRNPEKKKRGRPRKIKLEDDDYSTSELRTKENNVATCDNLDGIPIYSENKKTSSIEKVNPLNQNSEKKRCGRPRKIQMKDPVNNTGELGSKENNVATLDNLFTFTDSGNKDAISVDEVNYPTFINLENKDSTFVDNNINNAYEFLLNSVDEKVLFDNGDEDSVNLD